MNDYWSQWDSTELLSMHGVEIEEEKEEMDCVDDEEVQEKHEDAFQLYMLSWRDFF